MPRLRLSRHQWLAVASVLVFIPIAAMSGVSHGDVPPTGEAGQGLYEQHCAVCHGGQGKGDGPEAPFLSPRPGSLVSAATSVKSDTELLAIIENGKSRTAMPAWKDKLTDVQRKDVLAYIRSLIRFQKPGTPPPPAQ